MVVGHRPPYISPVCGIRPLLPRFACFIDIETIMGGLFPNGTRPRNRY